MTAGSLSATIGANGFLSVNLTPNAGALPGGSYYTAVYHLNDGTVSREYWVVPAATTASIAAVRAELEPSTMAVQSVTPAYVQGAVSAVSSNYLPLAGGTLSGPLTLNGDPMSSGQAATKHYADELSAQSLPLSGGTVAGPLNAQQIEGALYAEHQQSGTNTNDGIKMSLAECQAFGYACQVIAPALYSLAEPQAFGVQTGPGAGLKDYLGSGSYYRLYGPTSAQPSAAVLDNRYGVPQWFFNNPPAYPASNALDFAAPAYVMNVTRFPSGIGSWSPLAMVFQASAFKGGLNATNPVTNNDASGTLKTNFGNVQIWSWKYTQTQDTGDLNQELNCYGNGDCVGHQIIIRTWGGPNTGSDESNELEREFNTDVGTIFGATITGIAPAADGSLTIATTAQKYNGTQGEDRPAIDLTQGFSQGYLTAITTVGGNVAFQCPTSLCGWSTHFGVTTQTTLTSVVNNPENANSFPQSDTVWSVAASTGFTAGDVACIYDMNYECEKVTGVNTGTITVATDRLPHSVNAWVVRGAPTGYGAEALADEVTPGNTLGGLTPASTIRQVFPIMTLTTSNGTDTLSLFSGYDYLPGSGMESYTGRAYRSMGGAGGTVSLTISGGAVTACSASGGMGYINSSNPPQVNITGTWTTPPSVYISGISGGALSACAVATAGTGVTAATATPVTTNQYAIYPMTKVYQVYNAGIGQVDGTLYTEPPTGAFSPGDSIEQPLYFIDRHIFGEQEVGGYLPSHMAEPNFLRNVMCAGVWVTSDTCGDSFDNMAAGVMYRGWPLAQPHVVGNGQLGTPFGIQVEGPHNTGVYMPMPPFGNGVYGYQGTAALLVQCGGIPCSSWTAGYNFLQGSNAANGGDVLHYTPSNGSWTLTSGAAQYNGANAGCSYGFGSSGSAFSMTCNGVTSGFDTAGDLALTGSMKSQGAVTGASINGEVTVDGVTYTTLNAAWNAAVNLANTSGQDQTIRLGPGAFPVAATLTEPANGACVSLIGSGGTTMNADSPQIATTLTVPNPLGGDVFFLGNAAQAQGCTFRDLNLLAGANATHGFELQWFRGLLIDNLSVNDTTAEGILLGEETTTSGHQASFLLRNTTVSYSSAAFAPANRAAYGVHLQKTAMDSHLDDVVVRNALTAAVYNEGTGNTGYLIHGFGYPYTCTTAPCANNASSGSAANASYATSYVIYDTGGAGSVWTDTYVDSPAVAGFYVGANGVAIHGGHIQWPDVTSFPNANLAYVASGVSNNLLIADVDCLEMANGVNWITYAGASGNPPSYASVHHLTGCGNYYQALEPAVTTGFSSGGANINDPSGAVPRVWATPLAAAATDAAYAAQLYTGYQGDAFQAHFSGVNPFFNVTSQGTIRTNGGIALSTVINTAATLTLTAANKNVIANAASGPQTITLPSCYTTLPDKAMPTGLEFTIVKSDTTSNAVTLATTSGQVIYSQGSSAGTLVLSSPSTQTLVCGPDYNWYVAGSAAATFSGNASTATALAATPAQCAAGTYATGITANGTANCLQSWRFTWYGNFAGTFGTSTNNSMGAIWSPTSAITMTRLDIAVGTAPAGCSTWPVIGIYDSTAAAWLKTVTLAAGTYSYRNAVTGVSDHGGPQPLHGCADGGSGLQHESGLGAADHGIHHEPVSAVMAGRLGQAKGEPCLSGQADG